MINSEELKNIFYSGFSGACDWQLLDELEVLISEGVINYSKEIISSKDSYHKILDEVKVIEGLGPQEKGHMALKQLVKSYLERRGKEVLSEFQILGMHPDLISSDKKIAIECGTTDPGGILILLSNQNILFVGVLPYPGDSKNLLLYKFSRGHNFFDYKDWKLTKLRKSFQKYKDGFKIAP
jgi:hypothetical protein